MLLARLQGEDIAALARGVYRLADDSPRHPADELLPGREKAVVRPAVRGEVPRRLPFAERDRAPVAGGRLEHAERQRIDVGDRERLGVVRGGRELRCRLETSEDVRLLEDHAGSALGCGADLVRVGRAATVRDFDDLEPEARRVRLDDLPHLRIRGLGDDDLRLARRVLRDVARVGGDGRAVVAGRIRDVHAGELADRGLVLEDRLEHALAHLRLVGRVCRQELAALKHRVDDRGNVVVVDPGPEERKFAGRVVVARRELGQMRRELVLGERRLEVERAVEADAGGDVAEELVDRGDADRAQHLLPVGVGEGEIRVAHCSRSRRRPSRRLRSLVSCVEPTLTVPAPGAGQAGASAPW